MKAHKNQQNLFSNTEPEETPAPIPTLDAKRTRAKAKRAMSIVEANAAEKWKDFAYAMVIEASLQYGEFIADQVWELIEKAPERPEVHNKSALGPLMVKACKEGYTRSTGIFRKSIRPATHGKPLPVWESKNGGSRIPWESNGRSGSQ